jgi:hypothetical protein
MERPSTSVRGKAPDAGSLRSHSSPAPWRSDERSVGPVEPNAEILALQATVGNHAVARAIGGARGRSLQRAVGGIATPDALKADKQAWSVFLLLETAHQQNFQKDVVDATKDVPLADYIAFAKVSGTPVVQTWLEANLDAIAATKPGMIQIGGQDVADYGYGNLLRFRWFDVEGPMGPRGKGTKVRIATLGVNLHRGPKYAGIGSVWCKFGDDMTFEYIQNNLAGIDRAQMRRHLQQHATADSRNQIKRLANNANLPPAVAI